MAGRQRAHRKARRRLAVPEEQRIPRRIRRPDRRHLHPVARAPSSRTYPGVRGPRDHFVGGRWPAWGRPHATFPAVIATHTAGQVFYFGDDGRLRRLDHTVDVDAGAPAAHDAGGYKTFGGLASPSATGSTAPALTLRRCRCAVSPSCPDRARPHSKRPTVKTITIAAASR